MRVHLRLEPIWETGPGCSKLGKPVRPVAVWPLTLVQVTLEATKRVRKPREQLDALVDACTEPSDLSTSPVSGSPRPGQFPYD